MACEYWDIQRLSLGDRVLLKRNVGIKMGSDMYAIEAFYRSLKVYPQYETVSRIWYAMVCMECLWKPEEVRFRKPIEEMLAELYHHADTTPSMQRRIISILDISWGEDGFLLGKLSSFVKRMHNADSTTAPDFEQLAKDLVNWNNPDHYVQRKWIKNICLEKKEEKENAV